jgi:hypothetical protein
MPMKRKTAKNVILFTLALLLFASSYYRNIWGVVDKIEFEKSDIYSESQVLGRVIRAETNGIFSEAGLTGWVKDDSIMKDMSWDDMTYFQFDIYKNNLKLGNTEFIIYDSQMGGAGITFALLDKISPFSNYLNLYLFWMLNSFLFALLMTVFVSWVKKYYGFYASVITFLLLFVSCWLTFFGRDIYLVLTSFYLPFITLLILLHYESEGKTIISPGRLFLISVVLVFIKLFFTGFEFVTSALVMFTVPLFYYWFYNKWSFKFFIKRFITVSSGAVAGIIIYATLFSYQLSTLKGSFWDGFKYMWYCFLKRTSGDSADFPEAFRASLESSITEVVKTYLSLDAVHFGLIRISFLAVVCFAVIFSLLSSVSEKLSPTTYSNRKKNRALALTTWVALLGPLSWFIVFKAHAYIHLGFDEIVWYMPFCLFAFALIGSVSSSLIRDINIYLESQNTFSDPCKGKF